VGYERGQWRAARQARSSDERPDAVAEATDQMIQSPPRRSPHPVRKRSADSGGVVRDADRCSAARPPCGQVGGPGNLIS